VKRGGSIFRLLVTVCQFDAEIRRHSFHAGNCHGIVIDGIPEATFAAQSVAGFDEIDF